MKLKFFGGEGNDISNYIISFFLVFEMKKDLNFKLKVIWQIWENIVFYFDVIFFDCWFLNELFRNICDGQINLESRGYSIKYISYFFEKY